MMKCLITVIKKKKKTLTFQTRCHAIDAFFFFLNVHEYRSTCDIKDALATFLINE